MPKWSEMLTKLIPWRDTEDKDARRLRERAAAVRREQQALAPYIDAQTEYLVARGEVNGFTRQLRDGFRMKNVGE